MTFEINIAAMFVWAIIGFFVALILKLILTEEEFKLYAILLILLFLLPILWYWHVMSKMPFPENIIYWLEKMIPKIIGAYISETVGSILGSYIAYLFNDGHSRYWYL
jgi:hypothetical protein